MDRATEGLLPFECLPSWVAQQHSVCVFDESMGEYRFRACISPQGRWCNPKQSSAHFCDVSNSGTQDWSQDPGPWTLDLDPDSSLTCVVLLASGTVVFLSESLICVFSSSFSSQTPKQRRGTEEHCRISLRPGHHSDSDNCRSRGRLEDQPWYAKERKDPSRPCFGHTLLFRLSLASCASAMRQLYWSHAACTVQAA